MNDNICNHIHRCVMKSLFPQKWEGNVYFIKFGEMELDGIMYDYVWEYDYIKDKSFITVFG